MTRFVVLSTYPPTRCGIATFSESLATALVEPGAPRVEVVRLLDTAEPVPNAARRTALIADDPSTMAAAIGRLNAADVAIVQHEYGIYGGTDGDQVLTVLEALVVPTIVVLHTVLRSPTAAQRALLERVVALADVAVVMTAAARELLVTQYDVPGAGVRVIPHGVAQAVLAPARVHGVRPRVLTWGLIGPGKGIEWGIRAMAIVRESVPAVEYIVAGQTHPKVLAHSGDVYRDMLATTIGELGLGATVHLDDRYLEADDLAALVASADVVLLPYDSLEQVTSGVLVEAVAAGIPVVATGFPHAIELLAAGGGRIAVHRDPASMAAAIVSSLRDGSAVPVTTAPHAVGWADVADLYRALAAGLRSKAAA